MHRKRSRKFCLQDSYLFGYEVIRALISGKADRTQDQSPDTRAIQMPVLSRFKSVLRYSDVDQFKFEARELRVVFCFQPERDVDP